MNKLLLWGGAGVAALVGGFLLLRGGSAQAAPADSGGGGYVSGYPIVYGSGVSSGASGDGSGASTDNSIAQLIAGQLAIAQEQSSMTKYTSDNEKSIALAQYGTQQAIAVNDNATKLAITQNNNKTTVQQALASQLGSLSNSLGTKQGISGSIGFVDDKIQVDLKGLTKNSKTGTWS